MSDLFCPKCGNTLLEDENWMVTDRSLIGTEIDTGESLQGDYAHARCLQTDPEEDREIRTDGGADSDEMEDNLQNDSSNETRDIRR